MCGVIDPDMTQMYESCLSHDSYICIHESCLMYDVCRLMCDVRRLRHDSCVMYVDSDMTHVPQMYES